MDESLKDHAKRKKPNTKGYTLYDLIYKILQKRQNYRDKNHIDGCQGLVVGGGIDYKGM